MKEVKAFVHRARIGDIVHALEEAGFRHLSVVDVKGLLRALNDQEQSYSIEIGEAMLHNRFAITHTTLQTDHVAIGDVPAASCSFESHEKRHPT